VRFRIMIAARDRIVRVERRDRVSGSSKCNRKCGVEGRPASNASRSDSGWSISRARLPVFEGVLLNGGSWHASRYARWQESGMKYAFEVGKVGTAKN